ncbi:SEL1-like repeat protein [Persicobacter psychrovividus]|uniref:Sel1 repeat family protein n=1 Tax=Persicobacter psychrovividus TaxID=387638 RepID=A0ABM7VM84_9BACT|nr:hypothetical protein PEPS_43550 [Persicobacter psychrovividus]
MKKTTLFILLLLAFGAVQSSAQELPLDSLSITTNIKTLSKKAKRKDVDATYRLGLAYQNGWGVPKNNDKAFEAMKFSAEQGDPRAQVELAVGYKLGYGTAIDLEKARYWVEKSATQLNPSAIRLAFDWAFARGDKQATFDWAELGAKNDLAGAQYYLAFFYQKGIACDVDLQRAIHWAKRSANHQYIPAFRLLAEIYMDGAVENGRSDRDNFFEGIQWLEAAVELDDAESKYLLGNIYIESGDESKNEEGWSLIAESALANYTEAKFDMALVLFNDGDCLDDELKICVRLIEECAADGFAMAYNALGAFYEEGIYYKKDLKKAEDWYLKGAEKSYVEAQYNLGKLYLSQNATGELAEKGWNWLMQASDNGHVEAGFEIGLLLWYKNKDKATNIEAINYINRSAEAGYAPAQSFLADYFLHGYGVKIDKDKGFFWAKKSAEQHNTSGLRLLALAYFRGDGHTVDYQKAFELFVASAEQGDKYAPCMLGYMYGMGKGVERDLSKAASWYQMGADRGDTEAQSNLALVYLRGDGVAKDEKKAFEWMQKSADQGNGFAQFELSKMYLMGQGVKVNQRKAMEYLTQSAESGDKNAQYELATHYHEGKGVKKDLEKAIEWYHASAMQGHRDAQRYLGELMIQEGTTEEVKEGGRKWLKISEENPNEPVQRMVLEYEW